MLEEFLQSSSPVERDEETLNARGKMVRGGKKKTKKNRVEGVWVRAEGSSRERTLGNSFGGDGGCGRDGDEEDEMIWWIWEGGKIVGFVDW